MKKILIADDEHKIIMTLEYTFRKLLKEETPDIILLDIMMPNVDGYTTLQEIKKQEKLNQCKVIFLSAKTNPADIEKGLSLGADAYVTKPYSIKKLVQQVEELLA